MLPEPRFDHLVRMTTPWGLYEHALHGDPRPEHGYCLDDVSRALVVTVRQPAPTEQLQQLVGIYLRFTAAAQDGGGAFRNRRRDDRTWSDHPGVKDHWGRALWAVGTAAANTRGEVRARAVEIAARGMQVRSPWPRSMAYAALGAAEILRARPGDSASMRLLADARTLLGHTTVDRSWPWPEPRLTYANAVLPEALMAIGVALGDAPLLDQGLAQLRWLVALQTSQGGHLSVVPTGGWGPGDTQPGFDQQPIEVAALAEACWRAHEYTGDRRWLDALQGCADWFLGSNDVGLALYDPTTGGCSDGLHHDAVNANWGAESTLAALSTLQISRRAVRTAAA